MFMRIVRPRCLAISGFLLMAAVLNACAGSPASTPTQAPSSTPTLETSVSDPSDHAVLVVLYHATDGPNWNTNENWLTDKPISQWYGVSTDAGGRVTVLNLSENRLNGKIPPELGSLANLTVLDLGSN